MQSTLHKFPCQHRATVGCRVSAGNSIADIAKRQSVWPSCHPARQVITYLNTDTQVQGLLAVPCVVRQLLQDFVGSPFHITWQTASSASSSSQEAAALQSKSVDDAEANGTDQLADAKSVDVLPVLPISRLS